MLNEISTAELQSHLRDREGVTTYVVEPYQEYSITIGGETHAGTGPCIISVNED